MTALDKQEDEIARSISEIKQSIAGLKRILKSNDGCPVSTYKSRNAEFRILPPKIKVTLPKFIAQEVTTEKLLDLFGAISIKTNEHDGKLADIDTTLTKPLLKKPRIITTLMTDYGDFQKELHSVSCLSDEEIWACGNNDNIVRLYNIHGMLLESVKTKSGNEPQGIAVTLGGNLVYTDYLHRTVNIVKKKRYKTLSNY